MAFESLVNMKDYDQEVENITEDYQNFSISLYDTLTSNKISLRPEAKRTESLSTLSNPRTTFDILEEFFVLRNEQETQLFIEYHAFLIPVLLEAAQVISDYFDPATLYLEIFIDPEGENSDLLVLYISTKLKPIEAHGQMNRLEDEWWIHNIDRTGSKLCINLEFE